MKFNYILIIALITLVIYSCKSQKVNTPQKESEIPMETNNSFFVIGSGGGFTGKYNQFKVYNSGMVEKLNDETEDYEAYTEIEKELISAYFIELETLNIRERKFDHPGNMTFFIQVPVENALHTIKWGDFRFPMNKAVELFFEKVMTEIYKKER